ncbi:unnamed protein product [Nezara viridula]|uniref:Uncharacterized protein n=1 Tax=Nezara viridula TaxID=85310 RepID=A0A9P0E5W7_NEZVI|nr:unnamed protein product [Nezara viridula]
MEALEKIIAREGSADTLEPQVYFYSLGIKYGSYPRLRTNFKLFAVASLGKENEISSIQFEGVMRCLHNKKCVPRSMNAHQRPREVILRIRVVRVCPGQHERWPSVS